MFRYAGAFNSQGAAAGLAFANTFGVTGVGNYLWNDLQGRVYIVDLTPEEIAERIEKHGLRTALRVFEDASLRSESYGLWQKQTLNITDAPTHFILVKDLDF